MAEERWRSVYVAWLGAGIHDVPANPAHAHYMVNHGGYDDTPLDELRRLFILKEIHDG